MCIRSDNCINFAHLNLSMRLKQLHLWCLRCILVSVAWRNLGSSTLPWSGCRSNLRVTPVVHVWTVPILHVGGENMIPKNNDASTNNIHVHLGEERHYNSIKLHLSSLSDKTRWHKTLHLTLQLNPATQHPKKRWLANQSLKMAWR